MPNPEEKGVMMKPSSLTGGLTGPIIDAMLATGDKRTKALRFVVSLSLIALFLISISGGSPAAAARRRPLPPPGTQAKIPIRHVVIIDQENHSFDNMLGFLCSDVAAGRIVRPGYASKCDGTTTATLPDGSSYPMTQSADFGVHIDHSVKGQQRAMDGGTMNGFARSRSCDAHTGYACLTVYGALQGTCGLSGSDSCIPNLAALAENFTISDRTFEFGATPSWAGHMVLGSATLDGFKGENPKRSRFTDLRGPGWGCDSYKDSPWWNGSTYVDVPSCIPQVDGTGPYRASPVAHVPTIFDRMDVAGVSWRIYGVPGAHSTTPYGWSVCPTFADCWLTQQRENFVSIDRFKADAAGGSLAGFSIVTPKGLNSQHPPGSTSVGDNYLGDIIGAIESGPDWSSTAIFLTYDDCGCYYDHVNPLLENPEWGVRLPMIVISPYAKQGYTDSRVATFASLLTFTERVFGIPPLSPCSLSSDPYCSDDVTNGGGVPTYDYWKSFDFSQTPLAPVAMVRTRVKRAEARWLRAHPRAGAEET